MGRRPLSFTSSTIGKCGALHSAAKRRAPGVADDESSRGSVGSSPPAISRNGASGPRRASWIARADKRTALRQRRCDVLHQRRLADARLTADQSHAATAGVGLGHSRRQLAQLGSRSRSGGRGIARLLELCAHPAADELPAVLGAHGGAAAAIAFKGHESAQLTESILSKDDDTDPSWGADPAAGTARSRGDPRRRRAPAGHGRTRRGPGAGRSPRRPHV